MNAKQSKEEQSRLAKIRVAERKKKEDQDALKMFGLPIHRGELIADATTIFGFAYIEQVSNLWTYSVGSFPYLWGKFNGVAITLQRLEETEDAFFNYAFFILDEDLKPVEIILKFLVPKELSAFTDNPGADHSIVLLDLISMENFDVPPFNFDEY